MPVLTAPSPHDTAIERVITTLRQPAERTLRLSDMADVAGLSPFHFSRVFRDTIGIPPGEFSAALRLDQAKRLLLETELSVTDICFEVGYESLGAFTTKFTRLVGVPPSHFRHLPELTAPAFDQINREGFTCGAVVAHRAAITGRLIADPEQVGMAFIGLFPNGIASGRPLAGTLVTEPGPFQIADAPDGVYRLLTATLTDADPLSACQLPAEHLLVGAAGPVVIRNGRCTDPIELRLRPLSPLDPPILIALPVLLPDTIQARATG